jgi:dolichyl-phosphate-mannose--protein O-mannosyl transferase
MREPAVRVRFVIAFLIVVVLVSAFFYPMWTGMQVPFWFWTLHIWMPTWV